MEITIQCKCDAKFSITSKFKNQGSFSCPNCGRKLPGEMSEHIKGIFDSFNQLAKEVNDAELYNVEISATKI